MTDDLFYDVNYWAKQLEKTTDEAELLRKKMHEIPIPDLTYEERLELRRLLTDYSVVTKLLRDRLDQPEVKKQSFYKRLFRK